MSIQYLQNNTYTNLNVSLNVSAFDVHVILDFVIGVRGNMIINSVRLRTNAPILNQLLQVSTGPAHLQIVLQVIKQGLITLSGLHVGGVDLGTAAGLGVPIDEAIHLLGGLALDGLLVVGTRVPPRAWDRDGPAETVAEVRLGSRRHIANCKFVLKKW
jgi:hypothetical protein